MSTETQIVPLDFDRIRDDLRRYLKDKDVLRDYNFEGSALSLLVDVLAYDAYYHGWYTNFAVNESFLTTAQLRNSVVAAARQLGYVPRSASGAVALVDVTVNGLSASEGTITLERMTPFTTTVAGQTYQFHPIEDIVVSTNGASSVTIPSVALYEGVALTETFSVTTVPVDGVSVEIQNDNMDSRTLAVAVRPSAGSPTEYTFSKAVSTMTVEPTSNVYFVFETMRGTWEVRFGDGTLGRALQVGQEVVITYLNTRGSEATGANTFAYAGSPMGLVSQTSLITTTLTNATVPAYGGDARETITSIKQNAPNIYQTQGRIVTTYDAKAILMSEVSGLDSVAVWGGQEHDPPTYGTMFLAMKPKNSERYGQAQKDYIYRTVIQPKAMPVMRFTFLDPDYLELVVESVVRYSPASTNRTPEQIRQIVTDTIIRYGEERMGRFGTPFYFSNLMGLIDDAESSVLNNQTTVWLEKNTILPSTLGTFTVDFANPIATTTGLVSVSTKIDAQRFSHRTESGVLVHGCYLQNDGTWMSVYRDDKSGAKIATKSRIGTINPETGVVTMTNFAPINVTTTANQLRMRMVPLYTDLLPKRQQILTIPRSLVKVTVTADRLQSQFLR